MHWQKGSIEQNEKENMERKGGPAPVISSEPSKSWDFAGLSSSLILLFAQNTRSHLERNEKELSFFLSPHSKNRDFFAGQQRKTQNTLPSPRQTTVSHI